ncbi:hypothetical protein BDY21DRAFT_99254 [Lineolata rhizophorae]|uniref:Uncharacterized protein n=1 Tax=Lineolata rhizophorae TaxID=578093 RepID=A0A6A6NS80_9PEZI|nr:hypothetical protein BDY21DRAFT_99254 [Lineolata rhizophorae]
MTSARHPLQLPRQPSARDKGHHVHLRRHLSWSAAGIFGPRLLLLACAAGELPAICVDYFRKNPSPLPCFLSHVHSDHLQGPGSLKALFIYCPAATREIPGSCFVIGPFLSPTRVKLASSWSYALVRFLSFSLRTVYTIMLLRLDKYRIG